NMVSSVTVSDIIFKMFNVMKVFKSSMKEEMKKPKKVGLFCLSEEKKNSVLEKGKETMLKETKCLIEAPSLEKTVLFLMTLILPINPHPMLPTSKHNSDSEICL
ncbi:hypothetical protein STEG23_021195, partial [Scotinomys teguina]